MFWEDSFGGHHDVTKVGDKETTSLIREKLDSASTLYVFQLELNAATGSQTKAFSPGRQATNKKYADEVAKGDINNTARHIYNIAKNQKYNLWTDPDTCKTSTCNQRGWHYSLKNAINKMVPDWLADNSQGSEDQD